jgi:hypothetical protein
MWCPFLMGRQKAQMSDSRGMTLTFAYVSF